MKLRERLTKLSTDVFNEHTLDEEELRRHAEHEDEFIIIYNGDLEFQYVDEELFESETFNQVRGFSTGGVYGDEEFQEFLCEPLPELLSNTDLTVENFPIGYLRHLVLEPESRGNGDGFALALESFNNLAAQSDTVLALVWMYDGSKAMEIAEQFPIVERLHVFENYEMFDKGSHCPMCDVGENEDCTCSFAVYGTTEAEPIQV